MNNRATMGEGDATARNASIEQKKEKKSQRGANNKKKLEPVGGEIAGN